MFYSLQHTFFIKKDEELVVSYEWLTSEWDRTRTKILSSLGWSAENFPGYFESHPCQSIANYMCVKEYAELTSYSRKPNWYHHLDHEVGIRVKQNGVLLSHASGYGVTGQRESTRRLVGATQPTSRSAQRFFAFPRIQLSCKKKRGCSTIFDREDRDSSGNELKHGSH